MEQINLHASFPTWLWTASKLNMPPLYIEIGKKLCVLEKLKYMLLSWFIYNSSVAEQIIMNVLLFKLLYYVQCLKKNNNNCKFFTGWNKQFGFLFYIFL